MIIVCIAKVSIRCAIQTFHTSYVSLYIVNRGMIFLSVTSIQLIFPVLLQAFLGRKRWYLSKTWIQTCNSIKQKWIFFLLYKRFYGETWICELDLTEKLFLYFAKDGNFKVYLYWEVITEVQKHRVMEKNKGKCLIHSTNCYVAIKNCFLWFQFLCLFLPSFQKSNKSHTSILNMGKRFKKWEQ